MDADSSLPPSANPDDPDTETPKFPKQKWRHRRPEDEDEADDDLVEEDEAALLSSVLKRILRRKKSRKWCRVIG